MKAVIRLYKCHDMDLLLLKMVYHVNLAKTAKLCLKAFVDHENIVFLPCESPNPEIKYVYKKSQTKQAVRQIQFPTQSFVLRLNDDTEAPYITFSRVSYDVFKAVVENVSAYACSIRVCG